MFAQLFRRRTSPASPLDRPSPATRGYAVCTLPRSGSNVFCDLLGSTGSLGRPREYFNGAARRTYDDPTYPDDPQAQIGRILTMGATPNGIYALKVFPGLHDLVAPHLRWMEVLPNLSFIRFRRGDVLGQAVSWVRANQTQQFRSSDPRKGELSYDADAIGLRLRQICQRNARWDMFFARTGLPALDVTYEDFLADPDREVGRVAAFIGIAEWGRVDLDGSHFRRQRDESSAAWCDRFRAERGDPNQIDPFLDPV
ncbi:Stf0 family sulfotransferase [Methylobacterium symbioticum]|uniref:Trehalose 2-sulfotransferase n=1 Tax=Methylobacterium symbioticum TaxID=2584084 RepID=A0A509EBJ0_9HYPH|nr:Stf0 family sulfotransferase [Methylobacterium symbioticum]VUD71666.1 Trehalose 2-sulfotransferase [Methylobacterium symbioticum]